MTGMRKAWMEWIRTWLGKAIEEKHNPMENGESYMDHRAQYKIQEANNVMFKFRGQFVRYPVLMHIYFQTYSRNRWLNWWELVLGISLVSLRLEFETIIEMTFPPASFDVYLVIVCITMLRALSALFYLTFIMSLWGQYCYHLCFLNEETEAETVIEELLQDSTAWNW